MFCLLFFCLICACPSRHFDLMFVAINLSIINELCFLFYVQVDIPLRFYVHGNKFNCYFVCTFTCIPLMLTLFN